MKKSLKIILTILIILISIITLDTIQARLFKNSPIISWKEKLNQDSYVDKGILMDTYYCIWDKDLVTVSWHLKTSKFTCPLSDPEKFDFYISKSANNDSKYNEYLTISDRKIYFQNKIKEFYVIAGNTMPLKTYIKNNNQSLDKSIQKITNKLDYYSSLNDGGTTIYKSKDKDITIITCEAIAGSKDIYIGDYSTEYEQNLCRN